MLEAVKSCLLASRAERKWKAYIRHLMSVTMIYTIGLAALVYLLKMSSI